MNKSNKHFSKTLILASLISSPAFATTAGQYVGVDYLRTNAKFRERNNEVPRTAYGIANNSDGFGLNYKYAVNYGGFFAAPGVFFEKNNAKVNFNMPGYSDVEPRVDFKSVKVKERYGIKLDLGYDLTHDVSPYVTGGYAISDYSTVNGIASYSIPRNDRSGKLDKSQGNWFYGVGLKVDYNENVAFNLEYDIQKFSAKTDVLKNAMPGNNPDLKSKFDVKLGVMKIGVSYKF